MSSPAPTAHNFYRILRGLQLRAEKFKEIKQSMEKTEVCLGRLDAELAKIGRDSDWFQSQLDFSSGRVPASGVAGR
jgi:hypothetical protein